MNDYEKEKRRNQIIIVLAVILGLVALQNQRLTRTDPEHTYPKRIKRAIRLWMHPPKDKLEEQLIGKGIDCANGGELYKKVASATVAIKTGNALGAGVFIGPRLIVTAAHVVDGADVRVLLPSVKEDALAVPGEPIGVEDVRRVTGIDLAFVITKTPYRSFLPLERNFADDNELLIVGHPKGRYYSLQKALIRKKQMVAHSDFLVFKDNEVFFGNSGGAIVGCDGNLAGVVSMMSNYQNNRLKQGIGINARTIAQHMPSVAATAAATPVL